MQIVQLIPLRALPRHHPQILSYYMPITATQLPQVGSLVRVPFKNSKILGMVVSIKPFDQEKAVIKQAPFTLKPVDSIVEDKPIFQRSFISFLRWASLISLEPLSLLMKNAYPPYYHSKSDLRFRAMQKTRPSSADKFTHSFRDVSRSFITIKTIIAHSRADNRQALVVFPNIDSLRFLLRRLDDAGGSSCVADLHSLLTPKMYALRWREVLEGKKLIVFGTPKALLFPFSDLASVVVYDAANPLYHAWQARPRLFAPLLATSLAKLHRCRLISLAVMPDVEMIYQRKKHKLSIPPSTLTRKLLNKKTILIARDLEKEQEDFRYLASQIEERIKGVINRGGRVVIFQNRRGHSTFISCLECGFVFRCPNCGISLRYHKDKRNLLVCHYCQHKKPPTQLCPACKSRKLRWSGTGVERLIEETLRPFKGVPILRLDSDVVAGSAQKERILEKFSSLQPAILLGTVMLLNARLPRSELGVIPNVDLLLSLSHYASLEVALGLIKRLERQTSSLIIQSFNPTAFLLKSKRNKTILTVLNSELELRRKFFYPPFCFFVTIYFRTSAESEEFWRRFLELKKSIRISRRDLVAFNPQAAHSRHQPNSWMINFKLSRSKPSLLTILEGMIPPNSKVFVNTPQL